MPTDAGGRQPQPNQNIPTPPLAFPRWHPMPRAPVRRVAPHIPPIVRRDPYATVYTAINCWNPAVAEPKSRGPRIDADAFHRPGRPNPRPTSPRAREQARRDGAGEISTTTTSNRPARHPTCRRNAPRSAHHPRHADESPDHRHDQQDRPAPDIESASTSTTGPIVSPGQGTHRRHDARAGANR